MRSKRSPLDSRTSRAPLKPQKAPYWVVLEKGRALGYRKGAKSGEWVARYYDPLSKPATRQKGLGSADDYADADGVTILNYSQAQAAARKWFDAMHREETGSARKSMTVAEAVAEYLADRETHGAKTAKRMKWDFNAHVLPTLGDTDVSRMTRIKIEKWLGEVAASGRRRRGTIYEIKSEEEQKSRRNTANRIWTNLRAALNLAAETHGFERVWEGTRRFAGVDSQRIRFLSNDEAAKLVDLAEPEDFKRLVQAGLYTGAREGELNKVTKADFDGKRLWIAPGKTKKGRWIFLEEGAQKWFAGLTGDRLFPRKADGKKKVDIWQSKAVMELMRSTCEKAQIAELTFHELRHTYASRLLNRGVPLIFVAAQLGDNPKMVEKHYGHLCNKALESAILGGL